MVIMSNDRKTKKNTKNLLSKLMKKSKKVKNTKPIKVRPSKYIDKRTDLVIPTHRPNKFKIGTIKKGRDNKLWKVISIRVGKMNTKRWIRASTMDIKCNNYLQHSIKQNVMKYKRGNKHGNKLYKSINQSIAIAYAMKKKKFPKCLLINDNKK